MSACVPVCAVVTSSVGGEGVILPASCHTALPKSARQRQAPCQGGGGLHFQLPVDIKTQVIKCHLTCNVPQTPELNGKAGTSLLSRHYLQSPLLHTTRTRGCLAYDELFTAPFAAFDTPRNEESHQRTPR